MQNNATGVFTTSAGFQGARAAFSQAVTYLTLEAGPWGEKDTFLRSSHKAFHFPFH